MEREENLKKMMKSMRKLKSKLIRSGLIVQGTITERRIERKRQRGDRKKSNAEYGPYYQWTFKKDGKTVTVNLSPGQVGEFQKAIDNNKEVEAAMEEMRNLSREILDLSTPGAIRRKKQE